MTWPLLQSLTVLYLGGLLVFQRKHWQFLHYVWGAFGLTFLFIHLSLLQGWNEVVTALESVHVQSLLALMGTSVQVFERTTLLIPDSTGWTGLQVGIECSTLIELSVLAGLLLFYPRFSLQKRWTYLLLGAIGTYLLNLLRLLIIAAMVMTWGKSVVELAHAVVARLIYFVGVVALYWYLLTKPTLTMVRRSIEASGRAVT